MTKNDVIGVAFVLTVATLFFVVVGFYKEKFDPPSDPVVVGNVPVGARPNADGWKRYQAVVEKVVDGDTVDVVVDLGFDLSLRGRFRLAGINAPEMSTEAGKAAKARTEELLPVASHMFVETFHSDAKEKFGRYLGRFIQADGKSDVCEILVREGHAKVYWPK